MTALDMTALDMTALDMVGRSVVIDEGQRMIRWRCPIISE